MALSTNTYIYAGGSQTFVVNFALGFIQRSDVQVQVNGAVDGSGDPVYSAFDWIDDSNITVTDTLTTGDSVVIQRTVSKTELKVNFAANADVTPSNLDLSAKHGLMLYQELVDGRVEGVESPIVAADRSTAQATLSATSASESAVSAAAALVSETAAGVSETAAAVSEAAAAASAAIVVAGSAFHTDDYTGDGSTVAYAMLYEPNNKDNTQVYVDGVYQNKLGYSYVGTTLTFTEAPPINSSIEIVVARAFNAVTGDAELITYNQGGTGAVARTVESKLRESVSVKDFGAVGDGVTDDTVAIQAAIDTGRKVFAPAGIYLVASLTPTSNGYLNIYGEEGSTELKGKFSSSTGITSTGVVANNGRVYLSNLIFNGFNYCIHFLESFISSRLTKRIPSFFRIFVPLVKCLCPSFFALIIQRNQFSIFKTRIIYLARTKIELMLPTLCHSLLILRTQFRFH